MSIFCIVSFFVVATSNIGWTLLPDFAEFGFPIDIYSIDNETYNVSFERSFSGSFIRKEIRIDLSGNQSETYSENYVPAYFNRDRLFYYSRFPEDMEDPSACAAITRVTLSGDTLWTVQLDTLGSYVEAIARVLPCREGGCFVALKPYRSASLWKVYKLSDSGEVQMSSEYQMQGGPVILLSQIIETDDSNFLILGTTDDCGTNLYMYLVGIKSDGSQYINISEDLRFHASGELVEVDTDGNIYVAGYTGFDREDGFFMPPENTDIFLTKFDSAGNELWSSTFEYPGENRPIRMTVNEYGDVAVVMKSFSYEPDDQLQEYALIVYHPN